MQFQSILCICTGNICRSPLAEAYLRNALPSCAVASAGISAVVGRAAEGHARVIAVREGLDVSNHAGRQVDEELVTSHDLILVMENGQLEWMQNRFPEARGRIFMVSHWGDRKNVSDPFRQSADYFDAVYSRLVSCLDQWVDKLAPRSHEDAG